MSMSLTQFAIIAGKNCPYCGEEPELVNSKEVYNWDYGWLWMCKPCDAYVGCHKGTKQPLGRLANQSLRYWKKRAHLHFDRIWRTKKLLQRKEAYQWLSEQLEVDYKYTHIGMFTLSQCVVVVRISDEFINEANKQNQEQS